MLTVVLPTIAGREETCEQTYAVYQRTLADVEHEIVVVRDFPSWPAACNEGFRRAQGDVVHFTADDLEPVGDWYAAALQTLARDELPAGFVWNYTLGGDPDNVADGRTGELTHFTRVPTMRRDQWERVGAWPERLHYCADVWLSEKARTLGIETRLTDRYWFVHHWSQINRVSEQKTEEAYALMERLRVRDGLRPR